jgi:hypothetical protein
LASRGGSLRFDARGCPRSYSHPLAPSFVAPPPTHLSATGSSGDAMEKAARLLSKYSGGGGGGAGSRASGGSAGTRRPVQVHMPLTLRSP